MKFAELSNPLIPSIPAAKPKNRDRGQSAVLCACQFAAKVPLDGASDHGVSEALYLRDPDENGVELYWDRPKDQWPLHPDGSLAMKTEWLDLEGLLHEPPLT